MWMKGLCLVGGFAVMAVVGFLDPKVFAVCVFTIIGWQLLEHADHP